VLFVFIEFVQMCLGQIRPLFVLFFVLSPRFSSLLCAAPGSRPGYHVHFPFRHANMKGKWEMKEEEESPVRNKKRPENGKIFKCIVCWL